VEKNACLKLRACYLFLPFQSHLFLAIREEGSGKMLHVSLLVNPRDWMASPSARSMAPTYVRCKPHRAANSSCDQPRSLRKRRQFTATISTELRRCIEDKMPL
jgi:hypothetical protein